MTDSDHDLLLVPVRSGPQGCVSVRLCRCPDGRRTAVAFTSAAALERALGRGEPRVRISLAALRSGLAEVGVHQVQVDPPVVLTHGSVHRVAS
ncbi:MAG: hypothetical protein PGN07_06780 [Aeromicrobium erythreum]